MQALYITAVFFKKNQFFYCLLRSLAMLGGPMVDTKGKTFGIYVSRLLENAFFLYFLWYFRVLLGALKKS